MSPARRQSRGRGFGGARHHQDGAEAGQSTVEWVGLLLVVSLLALAIAAPAGARFPGAGLARAIAQRIVCAAGLGGDCALARDAELLAEYGPELAALVTEHAPRLDYEDGMRALPVDFRSCRQDACAEGADRGSVSASLAGEPVTLFTHVVDCREGRIEAREGYDCSGERAGNVYLQYWAYYPGSQTSRALFGERGFHPDDWEQLGVRVGPDGLQARASSHHGYNGDEADPVNDTGWLGSKPGWADYAGRYEISGGSHAGRVGREATASYRRPSSLPHGPWRWTPGRSVRIVPLESLRDEWGSWDFEVVPPWAKDVYRDPEFRGT